MSACKDELGNKYGRLLVLRRNGTVGGYGAGPGKGGRAKAAWLCRCDCGKEVTVTGECLRSGRTKSCGCYHSDRVKLPRKSAEDKVATNRARRKRELVARKTAKYGLSAQEQERLSKLQNGLCAFPSCNRPAGAFDHDHVTGRFRGLLCLQCNSMLGFSGDSSARLREAADYLEEHNNV